jgi:monoamine oxidase
MHSNKRIFIIGGGLNGLTLAYLLSKSKHNVTILEASRRLGGRIQTKKGNLETPLELGATWFSDIHQNLLALLDELGIERFFQFSKGISLFQTKSFEPAQSFYVLESESPSFRIAGGTQKIIESLTKNLADVEIHLNASVSQVKDLGSEMLIETKDGKKWSADTVVLCMPPHLVGVKISFSPDLSNDI